MSSNLSAKEKAKELVDRFQSGYSLNGFNYQFNNDLQDAKQCALIAVDEILKFDIKAKSEPQFVIEKRIEEYWQEVKQEIEKL